MRVGALAIVFGMGLFAISGCSRDKQGSAVAPPETSAYPELGCKHAEVEPNCTAGWCRIPAGCFVMGSPSSEWGRGRDDEEVRPITLTRSFEISEHETTQAEWTRVGFSNPSATRDWGKDCTEATCPVGNANWYEALAYANALSAAHSPPLAPCYDLSACTGQAGMGMECSSVKLLAPTSYECAGYRLPTEAEWEYAARAGTRSAFYSGDIRVNQDTATCYEEPNLDGIAWYCMNGQKQSHPVAGKSANGWGLYDVLGNVAEWVQDDKDDWVKLSAAGSTDPVGELDFLTSARVVRGGPVTGWSVILRSSAHFFAPPGGATAGPLQGFRLVRTLD